MKRTTLMVALAATALTYPAMADNVGVNLTPDPALNLVIPHAESPETAVGTIHGLAFSGDTIGVVIGVEGGLATTNIRNAAEGIRWMCRNGGEKALAFPDAENQQLLFYFDNGVLRVTGGEDSGIAGSASAGFTDWTLPGYEGLPWIWAQRAEEHQSTTEFTAAHYGALNMELCRSEPILLTPQRLEGWHGDDKEQILETMHRHLGQFQAYVVTVPGFMYIVPVIEGFGACGEVCVKPRLVVWHLHKTISPPPNNNRRVVKPPVKAYPPSGGDPLLFRCSGRSC